MLFLSTISIGDNLADALGGSQSFRMNGQFFRECPAGGPRLNHTFCMLYQLLR